MSKLDVFVAFAKNSKLIIADYRSREAHLDAMVQIYMTDKTAMLERWIGNAKARLVILAPLYNAALKASELPLDALTDIHNKLKELKDEQ